MDKNNDMISVGIRDKVTDKLIAVYPEVVQDLSRDVKKKVLDWYYKQNCDTSESIDRYYVGTLTETEFKSIQ